MRMGAWMLVFQQGGRPRRGQQDPDHRRTQRREPRHPGGPQRQDAASAEQTPRARKPPRSRAGRSENKRTMASSFDHGSSNVRVAGVPGLEPRTTEPETAVLPITPYPKGETGASHRESSLPDGSGSAKWSGSRRACRAPARIPSNAKRRTSANGVLLQAVRRASQPASVSDSNRRRRSVSSLPISSIDSNSGGDTRRPVIATRGGP